MAVFERNGEADGMRSLMTHVLNENNFNYDWIEKQLDHQERNHVRAAYLRTKFLEQRITMMQWYADWCQNPISRGNVDYLTVAFDQANVRGR